jgi:hypothetical protein
MTTEVDQTSERIRQYDDTGFGVAVQAQWAARGTRDSLYNDARQATIDALHALAYVMADEAGVSVTKRAKDTMPAWYGPAVEAAVREIRERNRT